MKKVETSQYLHSLILCILLLVKMFRHRSLHTASLLASYYILSYRFQLINAL